MSTWMRPMRPICVSPTSEIAPVSRVLFIANGNGEDSIAAAIIRDLPDNVTADAYPIIGKGGAYDGVCNIVGPRLSVPSEGWRHTKGSLRRDMFGGAFLGIGPAVKFLRSMREQYDSVVAVGDAVPLLLCAAARLPIDIYLDVFKSGYSHKYNIIERALIRHISKKTYCRDDMLAASLRQKGVPAVSAGNIMTDTIPRTNYNMAVKRLHPMAVTLMPGSRDWTAQSLKVQLEALRRMPSELDADIFVAVANSIDPQHLADEVGMDFKPSRSANPADLGKLSCKGIVAHLARGAVGNLIDASDLVLSQAGTGTQQALGLGKPVITFNRADNRKKRMADEQALMGDARILTGPDAKSLADALRALLADAGERRRLGEIGSKRLGGPGTLAAVVADLSAL